MSGLLTRGGGVNIPGIHVAYETRDFENLARGPVGQSQQKWLILKDVYITGESTDNIDDLEVQNFSNSSALAMELLQPCTKPS